MAQNLRFCPQCREDQPIFEFEAERTVLFRCQMCGYPVAEPVPDLSRVPARAVKPLVLHIDDDSTVRSIVNQILIRGGFTTISAADGKTGLELAKREKPTACLLDVMLPDLDGYEICRQLRATPALERMAIIMLTGSVDPKLHINAFKAGADLAIQKPFEEDELILIIRTALELKGVRCVL